MLEDFEADANFGRELTGDEISGFEQNSTEKFFGGRENGYVEMQKVRGQFGRYRILIRRK